MTAARLLLAALACGAAPFATPASAACVEVVVYGPVIAVCAGDGGSPLVCTPPGPPTVCVSPGA